MEFTWIYDCGAQFGPPSLQREIIRAREQLGARKHIDLLILSHLDEDHVNGLDDLLKGISVGRVVLPYLSKVDRLLLAGTSGTGAVMASYARLIADPVDYLQSASAGVGEVIFYEGDGLDDGERIQGELIPENENGIPDGDSPVPSLEVDGDLQPLPPGAGISGRHAHKGKLCREKLGLYIRGYWEFRFFNRKAWHGSVPLLRAKATMYISSILSKSGAKDYKKIIEGLRKVFRDPSQFGDGDVGRNDISLISYAGPGKQSKHRDGTGGNYPAAYGPIALLSQVGWGFPFVWDRDQTGAFLYTGDITMTQALADSLKSRLGNRWGRIAEFQVPHHGATGSWKCLRWPDWSHVWSIFSYGTENTYGHPGLPVLNDLCGRTSVLVNEHIGFYSWSLIGWA